MFGTLIAIVVAAVVFWLCSALGLPYVVGVVAAVVVLVTGIPTGGYGFGGRIQRAGTETGDLKTARRTTGSSAASFSEAQ